MVTSGDNGSSLYGTQNYGDYGVLSDATCGTVNGSQVCEHGIGKLVLCGRVSRTHA